MHRIRVPFSQSWIAASGRCELTCLGCPIWEKPAKELVQIDKRLYQQVKKGTYVIQAKWTNVTGANPFQNPYLPRILAAIRGQGGNVRLWTHGQASEDFWEAVRAWVDELVVFIPFSDPKAYREHTGSDGLAQVLKTIDEMRQTLSVKIAFRVTPENIDWLPELYELAYQNNVPLWILYNPKAGFTGDSIAFIQRYHRVKTVSVFRDTYQIPGLCHVFGTGVLSTWQQIRNYFR